MTAPKTRRLVPAAAAAMLLAVPALSSCGVNFGAQTDQYYTPSDGENNREGSVDVLDAVIISDTPGSGRLIAALENEADADDTLTEVRGLEDDASVDFSIGEGETTIPAHGVLQLADDGSAVVAVTGDATQVAAGGYVRVAFVFQNGEEADVNVPVLAPGEIYGDIELPSPSATASPAGKKG